MNAQLQSIAASLEEQQASLEAGIAERMLEVDAMRDTLKRIEGALAALQQQSPCGEGRRPLPRKQAKPCATKDSVLAIVTRLLADNEAIPLDDLMELTRARLKEEGKSLSGYQLRWQETMSDPRIVIAPPGIARLTVSDEQVRN